MPVAHQFTEAFRLLADGDGFPTEAKLKYWKDSGWEDFLESYRIRSSKQEDVFDVENYRSGISPFNKTYREAFLIPSQGRVIYPAEWNDARFGFKKGTINYVPLSAKEASIAYWTFNGFNVTSLGTLTAPKVSCATPDVLDIDTTYYNRENGSQISATPINRLWLSGNYSVDPIRFSQNTTYVTDAGNSYRAPTYARSSVSSGATIRPTFGCLTRYGNNAFGFEELFNASYSRSHSYDNQEEDDDGAKGVDCTLEIASHMYIPNDDEYEQYNFDWKFREVIAENTVQTIDGVPFIARRVNVRTGSGIFMGGFPSLSPFITGARTWGRPDNLIVD